MIAPAPRKLICANTTASCSSSAGAFMRRNAASVTSGAPIVRAAAVAPVRIVPAATERRTPAASPAPNACAVGIANPEVSPQAKPSSRNSRLPVAPTAASAPMPR